jgi:hypothetical protein
MPFASHLSGSETPLVHDHSQKPGATVVDVAVAVVVVVLVVVVQSA